MVYRSVLEGYSLGRLYLNANDIVVHGVCIDVDVYGVSGVDKGVLEEFFNGLVTLEKCSPRLRGISISFLFVLYL